MVLLNIFFTRIRSTEGSSTRNCSLFILSLHTLALHLAVKILLQIFLYEDLSTTNLTYICRLYFLENASRTALCYIIILLSENIPNIWRNHQQNTRRSDQIETIKTIMQTTRPQYHMEGLPMAQVAIFKEIFDQVRKDLNC